MLNYFISLVKHLPEVKKMEYGLTIHCYWHEGSDNLKEAFINKNDPSRKSNEIPRIVDVLVDIFKKMPLSLQMGHIFDINCYHDECTYMEDYKVSSFAAQSVLINRIMVSYAEVILPQLDKDKKSEFLQELHKNIRKGGFMGAKYHEEDELALIEKWKLENELVINTAPTHKKVVKL
jgi:hypothetical protein